MPRGNAWLSAIAAHVVTFVPSHRCPRFLKLQGVAVVRADTRRPDRWIRAWHGRTLRSRARPQFSRNIRVIPLVLWIFAREDDKGSIASPSGTRSQARQEKQIGGEPRLLPLRGADPEPLVYGGAVDRARGDVFEPTPLATRMPAADRDRLAPVQAARLLGLKLAPPSGRRIGLQVDRPEALVFRTRMVGGKLVLERSIGDNQGRPIRQCRGSGGAR